MIEYSNPFNFPTVAIDDSDELLTKEEFVAGTTLDCRDYNYRQLPKEIIDNLSTKAVAKLFKPYIEDKYEVLVEAILAERKEKKEVTDGNKL